MPYRDAVSGSDAVVRYREGYFSVPGARLDVVGAAFVPDRVQILFGRGLLLSQPQPDVAGCRRFEHRRAGSGRQKMWVAAHNFSAGVRAPRPACAIPPYPPCIPMSPMQPMLPCATATRPVSDRESSDAGSSAEYDTRSSGRETGGALQPTRGTGACGYRPGEPPGLVAVGVRRRPVPGSAKEGPSLRMRITVAVVAAIVLPSHVAAQDFLLDWHRVWSAGRQWECSYRSFDVPRRADPRRLRVAVAAPSGVTLRVSFDADYDENGWDWDSYDNFTVGHSGFFELTHLFPTGPQVTVAVNVCDSEKRALTFTAQAHVVSRARIPHNSDRMDHDDRLYRELIYDAYDNPGGTEWSDRSWVLRTKAPKFYIQLGNEYGRCGNQARVSLLAMHFWRAIIPVLAEQLTGVPYPHRVEADCAVREDEYGWVTVKHVTPEEYFEETEQEWGHAAGRARAGWHTGRIWILHEGQPAQPTDEYRALVAHEIGHAFGLKHTGRRGAIMESGGWTKPNTLHVFTPAEENAARAAYRVGRGARYCGDPYRCGSGLVPGESRSFGLLTPQIVVD